MNEEKIVENKIIKKIKRTRNNANDSSSIREKSK